MHTKQALNSDTTNKAVLSKYLLNQNNHMISFMPRYITKVGEKQHMLMLMETFQTNKDGNALTRQYSELITLFSNLMYSITYLKTGLSINVSVFQTRVKNYAVSQNTLGLNAGLSKAIAKAKLNIGTNVSYSSNQQSNTINSKIMSFSWLPV